MYLLPAMNKRDASFYQLIHSCGKTNWDYPVFYQIKIYVIILYPSNMLSWLEGALINVTIQDVPLVVSPDGEYNFINLGYS